MEHANGELVPLSSVISAAYDELVRDKTDELRVEVLNLLALGMTLDVPIYYLGDGGELQQLQAEHIVAGRFTDGGAKLEFDDGATPLAGLRVRLADLPRVIRDAVQKSAGR